MIFRSKKKRTAVADHEGPESIGPSSNLSPYPGPKAIPGTTSPTQGQSSTSPTASNPLETPKNFVYIDHPHTSVDGSFRIDPSMAIPPSMSMLAPSFPEAGRTRPNLFLKSQHCSINALISLVPCLPDPADSATTPEAEQQQPAPNATPKRVIIEAISTHGSVTVAIRERSDHKFYLKVASKDRNIIVRLPPDFHGHIHYTAQNHRVRFTRALQERMPTGSVPEKTGDYFVNMGSRGEGEAGGSQDGGDVEGDEVYVLGGHGKIKFCVWGEEKESEGQRALRQLKEDGPIVSIVKLLTRVVEYQLSKVTPLC